MLFAYNNAYLHVMIVHRRFEAILYAPSQGSETYMYSHTYMVFNSLPRLNIYSARNFVEKKTTFLLIYKFDLTVIYNLFSTYQIGYLSVGVLFNLTIIQFNTSKHF